MTHVVDTGVATLRHNQNHPGSVPVPARGVPACSASENSFLESEGLLGSRETPRTRHGRVRGPHQHHRRTPFPVPVMRQIEPLLGGRRGAGHSPVDPDTTVLLDHPDRPCLAGHHERGIPVPEAIAGDAHTRRLRRQCPRPHHRNTHAFGQHQPAVPDPEPAAGVLERRQGLLPRLEARPAPALDRARGVQRLRVGAQHLLLGDLGTVPQPRRAGSGFGQLPAKCPETRLAARRELVDGFVPQEPAATPLLDQGSGGGGARPQPVVVAHHLDPHARHANRPHRQVCPTPPLPRKEDGASSPS